MRRAQLEGCPTSRSTSVLLLEKISPVDAISMDIHPHMCAARNMDGFWRCRIAADRDVVFPIRVTTSVYLIRILHMGTVGSFHQLPVCVRATMAKGVPEDAVCITLRSS